MNYKIIYIAGSNHSGSTLVGCILGANPNPFRYFHAGEMHAYFNQENERFGNPGAAKKMIYGDIWNKINPNVGLENAYSEIFAKTGAEGIIDSSKYLKFFNQSVYNKKDNWDVYVIIPYKSFNLLIDSYKKRKFSRYQINNNLLYYKQLLNFISSINFKVASVDIVSLIENPKDVTKKLCKFTNIPYFDKKELYWNYYSCHLYGAGIQRSHCLKPWEAKYDISKISSNSRYKLHKNMRNIENKIVEYEIRD